VRIHAHGGTDAHDVFFAVELDRSGICIGADRIDQDHGIVRGKLIDQVQGRGSQVGDFDAILELVVGGQEPRDVWADAVIAQQDISDPAN
jgi:hypothetical protein